MVIKLYPKTRNNYQSYQGSVALPTYIDSSNIFSHDIILFLFLVY